MCFAKSNFFFSSLCSQDSKQNRRFDTLRIFVFILKKYMLSYALHFDQVPSYPFRLEKVSVYPLHVDRMSAYLLHLENVSREGGGEWRRHRERIHRGRIQRESFFTLLVLFVKNRCFKVAKTRLQDFFIFFYFSILFFNLFKDKNSFKVSSAGLVQF